MKYLILILLFIPQVFANYIPKSMVGQSGMAVFTSPKKCQKHYSEKCIKIPSGYNHDFHALTNEMADDLDSPMWATRSMVSSCDGKQDCKDKALELAMECKNNRSAYYNAEFTEVWCNKITGYAQKETGNKVVTVDKDKRATYLAAKQAERDAEKELRATIRELKTKLRTEDLTLKDAKKVLLFLLRSIQ